jgi:hypothetical protein
VPHKVQKTPYIQMFASATVMLKVKLAYFMRSMCRVRLKCVDHFRFRSKRGHCERKQFRLKPKKCQAKPAHPRLGERSLWLIRVPCGHPD